VKQPSPSKRRWEVYPGYPNRVGLGGPRVTLNSRGVFLMNTTAYKAMKEPPAVELRYDPNTRTIGLAPKDPRNVNAFPVKGKDNPRKYQYRIIHGSPFCKHYNITPRRTILFTQIDLDDDGTLTLELKTAVTVGKGIRN
jgi:hypothetical protein